MSNEIILVVAEVDHSGRYDGWIEGQRIVAGSSQPFVTAARKLIAEGRNPTARYVMRRQSEGGSDALISTLGAAAKLRVKDDTNGRPVFADYRPYDRR